MYISKETLIHYRQLFDRLKETNKFAGHKTELQSFLKLLNNSLDHIKKENEFKKIINELYLEYGGSHAGGIFNMATTRGSSLLLVESWFDDIKAIEGLFLQLQKQVNAFLALKEGTQEFKSRLSKIILLCNKTITESSLLANRMKTFFSEEHYQHRLLDSKNLDEYEAIIAGWLC